MSHRGISRRRFVQSAIGIVTLTLVKGGQVVVAAEHPEQGKHEILGGHESDTLLQVVQHLFPYKGLGERPYQIVVETVESTAEIAHLLKAGVSELDADAYPGTWLALPDVQRMEVLKQIESGEFFKLMLNAGIHGLHSNQELWDLIGYEGSSVEHGGYINRGFNDIDWLPEQAG